MRARAVVRALIVLVDDAAPAMSGHDVPMLKNIATALVPALAFMSTSCAPELERCNSDAECGIRACVLGTCVTAGDERGEVPALDAPPDVDDGDGDDGDDGDVDVDDGDDGEAPASDLDGCGGVLAFLDGDGDGFGAGDRLCVPSVGAGLTSDGGDCDDDDAGVFALRSVFLDGDGDGFTAGSELACVGTAAPDGTSFEQRAPPIHVVEPVTVEPIEGIWSTTPLAMIPSSLGTGVVRLAGFACAAAPPAEVTGLAVHLRLTSTASSNVHVRVMIEGSATVREANVLADGTVAVLGGDGDTFDALLDPAAICDGRLAVYVRLTSSAPDVLVEPSLRVFGAAEDCDDADASRFSAAALRDDLDGDGFAAGFAQSACIGDDVPTQKKVRARDCDDVDVEAFPGQGRRFLRERASGGFDFNCNAIEERDVAEIRVASCERAGPNNVCRERFTTRSVQCGDTVSYAFRCNNACDKVHTTVEQACR